jgi:hypothetical protein
MISPDINWSQNDTVNPSVQLYGATKHGSFKRPEIKNKIEFVCHPKQNKTKQASTQQKYSFALYCILTDHF